MIEYDIIRRCRFSPYLKGHGPRFGLTVWDTHKRDGRGQSVLGYRLTIAEDRARPATIFEGEDFAGSPLHCDDSDETIACLMGFLTLRPGDTDDEYFESYTPRQLEYCDQYAEALSCEILCRFGEF